MKKLIILLLILFTTTTISEAIIKGKKIKHKEQNKILMIIAHNNFRDEEYFVPKKIFTEKWYKVITASSSLKYAKGMLGGKVKPDILINDVKVKEYCAIVFVGGSGSTEYWNSKIAHKIAREAVAQKKVLGAICLAPGTLAIAGVLKNRKATVYVSAKRVLKEKGAIYIDKNVVVDDLIVTANGPSAAKKFAKKILKLLKKNKK